MAQRGIQRVFSPGSKHWVGDGFPVRNLFPSHQIQREVSPFLLLDYAGPRDFPPSDRPRGVGEHPHRGFETVTLLYQGGLDHRDSSGVSGSLGPGDVQWMTAASGVVHEERHGRNLSQKGGTFEAVQIWVNLPRAHKMDSPAYQDIPKDHIPVLTPKPGVSLRVIAGEFQGKAGTAHTYTPVELWDLKMESGASLDIPIPQGHHGSVFLLSGQVQLNDSQRVEEAQLALLEDEGENFSCRALVDSKLLVLGGEPIAEPIVSRGPFVMNTQEEIVQAVLDYQSGKMGHLP